MTPTSMPVVPLDSPVAEETDSFRRVPACPPVQARGSNPPPSMPPMHAPAPLSPSPAPAATTQQATLWEELPLAYARPGLGWEEPAGRPIDPPRVARLGQAPPEAVEVVEEAPKPKRVFSVRQWVLLASSVLVFLVSGGALVLALWFVPSTDGQRVDYVDESLETLEAVVPATPVAATPEPVATPENVPDATPTATPEPRATPATRSTPTPVPTRTPRPTPKDPPRAGQVPTVIQPPRAATPTPAPTPRATPAPTPPPAPKGGLTVRTAAGWTKGEMVVSCAGTSKRYTLAGGAVRVGTVSPSCTVYVKCEGGRAAKQFLPETGSATCSGCTETESSAICQ
jgi:hypothetical protein